MDSGSCSQMTTSCKCAIWLARSCQKSSVDFLVRIRGTKFVISCKLRVLFVLLTSLQLKWNKRLSLINASYLGPHPSPVPPLRTP